MYAVPSKCCITVCHPRENMPRSRTRTWSGAITPFAVMEHCVCWMWADHVVARGSGDRLLTLVDETSETLVVPQVLNVAGQSACSLWS